MNRWSVRGGPLAAEVSLRDSDERCEREEQRDEDRHAQPGRATRSILLPPVARTHAAPQEGQHGREGQAENSAELFAVNIENLAGNFNLFQF